MDFIRGAITNTRVSQKNGPSIFKNISWKSGLVHSFEEFLSKLFIKNQIEKCDLPNCFMCIMMKGPFFWGISLQNILLKLRMGHSFEEKNDGPFFWDTLVYRIDSSYHYEINRFICNDEYGRPEDRPSNYQVIIYSKSPHYIINLAVGLTGRTNFELYYDALIAFEQ